MESKTRNTHKQVFDAYLRKLEEEGINAPIEEEKLFVERWEKLMLAVGLFDHNHYALDYCYTFETEGDAWAFYRYAVSEDTQALNLSVSSWDGKWMVVA
jgi:hypothetical protein